MVQRPADVINAILYGVINAILAIPACLDTPRSFLVMAPMLM